MQVYGVNAFDDNYIWVVDEGEGQVGDRINLQVDVSKFAFKLRIGVVRRRVGGSCGHGDDEVDVGAIGSLTEVREAHDMVGSVAGGVSEVVVGESRELIIEEDLIGVAANLRRNGRRGLDWRSFVLFLTGGRWAVRRAFSNGW